MPATAPFEYDIPTVETPPFQITTVNSRHEVSTIPIDENCLEPRETSRIPDRATSYRDHLALEFPSKMSAVEQMYSTVSIDLGKNYFSRLTACRSNAIFKRNSESGKVKVMSDHCGLRWCPLCAKTRQATIMHEVEAWFSRIHKPVLMTLTLKHSASGLKHQLKYLYKYFQKLRGRKFLKKLVRGGIWFFHIKKSKADDLWHPHLHCLMDADWIDKQKLSDLWKRITGGSYIVHLKTVTNPANSVRHAARYAAESCDLSDMSESDACEVFYALHKRRLAGTWGTGRTMNLRKKPDDSAGEWRSVGTWNNVMNLRHHDDHAAAIWKAYRTGNELDPSASMMTIEYDMEGREPIPPPRLFFQMAFNFSV